MINVALACTSLVDAMVETGLGSAASSVIISNYNDFVEKKSEKK